MWFIKDSARFIEKFTSFFDFGIIITSTGYKGAIIHRNGKIVKDTENAPRNRSGIRIPMAKR